MDFKTRKKGKTGNLKEMFERINKDREIKDATEIVEKKTCFNELKKAEIFAKELELIERYNKIERIEKQHERKRRDGKIVRKYTTVYYIVYSKCTWNEWREIYNKVQNLFIEELADFELTDTYNDNEQAGYDDYSGESILEGGYGNPSADEWDRSGLL